MILQLATKHQRQIAFGFLYLLLFAYVPKLYAGGAVPPAYGYSSGNGVLPVRKTRAMPRVLVVKPADVSKKIRKEPQPFSPVLNGGGPTQPEMSTFKSVSANNLVDLFTGDFNYNIPLLDVGGYPVNIFYSGGISMEQEASWVGLGWNINPGTITRNMRGVPDDFNGSEMLTETQNMKPNITLGASVGADFELTGIKIPDVKLTLGGTLGASYNNYLGPSIELGVQGGAQFKLVDKVASEKAKIDSLKLNVGLSANASSRGGVTISPNASLTAFAAKDLRSVGNGISLSTSYNSRSGISELQISEQMSKNYYAAKHEPPVTQSGTMASTAISFARPSYIPAIRMPITNSATSARFQTGLGIFGASASTQFEVYEQKAQIGDDDIVQQKPLIGYLYYQNAKADPNAVMDFSRIEDKEVTPHTPIISVPQYTYDVFSIQGEGTGGAFRAYRTEESGYVRDNLTQSKDKSEGFGADIGVPGHYGANFDLVKTPSTIGDWSAGNRLYSYTGFTSSPGVHESVYFRNPGETSVLDPGQYDAIGGTDLVRFALGGTNESPTLEPTLLSYTKDHQLKGAPKTFNLKPAEKSRIKRSQVISFLTADEAARGSLDTKIRSYEMNQSFAPGDALRYTEVDRVAEKRMANHLSEIDVLEGNGKRYIYGLPVYNLDQTDITFSVGGKDEGNNQVSVGSDEVSPNSGYITGKSSVERDGMYQERQIPAYAHSFLLTGLLSPDYVDVTGDGITEDDLGTAVKFNYTKMKNSYRWKTPFGSHRANFNAGNFTVPEDDKGLISYGERESWYLNSIESKTMIAIFTLEGRDDGKGVASYNDQGRIDNILEGMNDKDDALQRLQKIDLYSKADLKANGKLAKPVKTVVFDYGYDLCKKNPDSKGGQGKLTLQGIHFYFNGQDENTSQKNMYRFSYLSERKSGDGNLPENPDYQAGASDRWNSYKPAALNPGGLSNALYPYAIQDNTLDKTTRDQYASAWALKKISLPSGGIIQVKYESDDYAYVQNRRAANMTSIAGFGSSDHAKLGNFNLYDNTGAIPKPGTGSDPEFTTIANNDYLFIDAKEPCTKEIIQNYIGGLQQLSFRLAVKTDDGPEYITAYADIEKYDVYEDNPNYFWIKMKEVDGYSPLALTAVEYLRENLPGQAYPGYDVSEEKGLEQIGHILAGWLDGLTSAFSNPINHLMSRRRAKLVDGRASFVRLNDPDGYKYGGGQRVSSVTVSDNWQNMSGQFTSQYGQKYTYETTEFVNGKERTISSGVASYEPSIGSEENPFRSVVQVSDKLPLGPTNYGCVEMPVLDAFFQAPVVGYSKVTVESIRKSTDEKYTALRSKTGKQVTEFYTAKDYPTYYNNTAFDRSSDKQEHRSSTQLFLYKEAYDSRALSQGFIVATNDMHGKMKSQASYSATDDKSPINYTQNFYRNTGVNGMDETFDFAYGAKQGIVEKGNMGIDVELMTDAREFSVESNSLDVQGQLDLYPIFFPFWVPVVWPVVGNSENVYHAVTTTKVISYHSVLDSVVVIDKGSQVGTKNRVFDAETGNVIVSRTNNEFDQPVYNTNYPAYWAYSGMGQAYKNVGATFLANFLDGQCTLITPVKNLQDVFESGDEILVTSGTDVTGGCRTLDNGDTLIWAFDRTKENSSLTPSKPDFVFIDKEGMPYTKTGVFIKIIRSGKRNMLDATLEAVTTMTDPVAVLKDRQRQILIGNEEHNMIDKSNVISASALLYKEKWQNDRDVFNTYRRVDGTDGRNLVQNGMFEGVEQKFSTEYAQSYDENNLYGQYYIGTSWAKSGGDESVDDHTTGYSNVMFVDGDAPAGDHRSGTTVSYPRIWYENVTVQKNTQYNFSVWIYNRKTNNAPKLRLTVDDGPVSISDKTSAPFSMGSWQNFTTAWNSGEHTSVVLAIRDPVHEGDGNDFALDDITCRALTTCNPKEVFDCDGYLEEHVNPYRRGLLGNFRSYQDMAFYGPRTETDTRNATNLPTDGTFLSFRLFWDFDESSHLVPKEDDKQWTWKTQSTKFNSRGLELENRNALDIYTAAQYGYQKSMPVAITNNSKYSETAYEGFEDGTYEGYLNNLQKPFCEKTKPIDFSGLGRPVEASRYGIEAHTGKYVLTMNPRATLQQTFNCGSVENPFQLVIGREDAGRLINQGVTYQVAAQSPDASTSTVTVETRSSATGLSMSAHQDGSLDLDCDYEHNSFTKSHSYTLATTHYLEIFNCGDYKFKASSDNGYVDGVTEFCNPMKFTIYDQDNNVVPVSFLTRVNTIDEYYTAYLQKGIYRIECSLTGGGAFKCTGFLSPECDIPNATGGNTNRKIVQPGNDTLGIKGGNTSAKSGQPENNLFFGCGNTCGFQKTQDWNLSVAGGTFPAYVNTQSGCTVNKPIPATVDMFNPAFAVPKQKKMLFSCWMRENCVPVQGRNNCPQSTITLTFDEGTSSIILPVSPSGPVIEGWQKCEASFTAPDDATKMTVSFTNNSSGNVFIDDIRLHPFNANMKSYVYDPVSLRLNAELDENNYATFYEYDEEGTLIRVKAETKNGVKTIKESRSGLQQSPDVQKYLEENF